MRNYDWRLRTESDSHAWSAPHMYLPLSSNKNKKCVIENWINTILIEITIFEDEIDKITYRNSVTFELKSSRVTSFRFQN